MEIVDRVSCRVVCKIWLIGLIKAFVQWSKYWLERSWLKHILWLLFTSTLVLFLHEQKMPLLRARKRFLYQDSYSFENFQVNHIVLLSIKKWIFLVSFSTDETELQMFGIVRRDELSFKNVMVEMAFFSGARRVGGDGVLHQRILQRGLQAQPEKGKECYPLRRHCLRGQPFLQSILPTGFPPKSEISRRGRRENSVQFWSRVWSERWTGQCRKWRRKLRRNYAALESTIEWSPGRQKGMEWKEVISFKMTLFSWDLDCIF